MNFQGAEVFFAYPAPENFSSCEVFFSPCAVHFGAETSELRIPVDWLELPINSGNESLSDMTTAMCERLLGPGKSAQMDMPSAQLRKRLYRAGTSYKSIVLKARMGLAWHYLETTHLSIQEIAFLLDYAQPGPFSRAFKKYFGDSPRTMRNCSIENAHQSVRNLHVV